MSQYNPYEPPPIIGKSPDKIDYTLAKPTVVTWYQVYCCLMMTLYVVVGIGAVALYLNLDNLGEMEGEDRTMLTIQSLIYVAMSVPLTIFFLVGFLVPRRRWGWIYGIIAIALGLTSCCTWPATIPLLIYWLKPETKAYFGY